jgi:hypothetical protein
MASQTLACGENMTHLRRSTLRQSLRCPISRLDKERAAIFMLAGLAAEISRPRHPYNSEKRNFDRIIRNKIGMRLRVARAVVKLRDKRELRYPYGALSRNH